MFISRATELGRDSDIRRNVSTGSLLAPQPKARTKKLGHQTTARQKNAYFTCTYQMMQFDASRRGKKILNSSRDKTVGTFRSGEGGGGPAM